MLRIKININPRYQDLSPFVQSIHEEFETKGKTIHEGRNEIKVYKENGILLNVKRFQVPIYLNRIIYSTFRLPKAERSYRNAFWLKEKNVCTPEAVGLVSVYRNGLLHLSYFISIQLEGYETSYEIQKKPLEEIRPYLQALAKFTAYLHKNNIFHQDFSPGNILYKIENNEYQFCLVDTNRMTFSAVSEEKGCSNLKRLWGKEENLIFLAREYAQCRGIDEEKCIQWVLHYRKLFWKKFALKHPVSFEL